MTVMVPYDGSPLAQAALRRGRQLTDALSTPLLAVTVLPEDPDYAAGKDWLAGDGGFEPDRIVAGLRHQITELAPEAGFRCLRVEGEVGPDGLAGRLRAQAAEAGATVVVLGSHSPDPLLEALLGPEEPGPAVECDVYVVRTRPAGRAE